MHRSWSWFPITCILWVFVLTATGCRTVPIEQQAAAPAVQREPLRVGVSTNAPPIIFKDNGKITGLEASLAQKLGDYLNKEIVYVEVPWNKQLDYLNQGKTDIIMSGMTITPQRQYLVTFTTPYLRSGQIMLVRLEDRRKFSRGVVDLMNSQHKIGTIANTTGDFFVTEAITNANEVSFATSAEAVRALGDGKIDALVYDAPMVCHYAAANHAKKLVPILVMATEEYLAWAVRKNDAELTKQVNRFLQVISEDGVLQQEINRWIPYLGG